MITQDEFIAAYATELRKAMESFPAKYAPGLDPVVVATKMTEAIRIGTFNHDSPALKVLAKKMMGITKYGRGPVLHWFKANVEPPPSVAEIETAFASQEPRPTETIKADITALRNEIDPASILLAGGTLSQADLDVATKASDLVKHIRLPGTVNINVDTDLEQYFGQTVYVRTAMNAYFGKLVDEKDDHVQLEGAYDSFGETDLTLRVPRTCAVAIVPYAPRVPVPSDYDTLRGSIRAIYPPLGDVGDAL